MERHVFHACEVPRGDLSQTQFGSWRLATCDRPVDECRSQLQVRQRRLECSLIGVLVRCGVGCPCSIDDAGKVPIRCNLRLCKWTTKIWECGNPAHGLRAGLGNCRFGSKADIRRCPLIFLDKYLVVSAIAR